MKEKEERKYDTALEREKRFPKGKGRGNRLPIILDSPR
jgi:hypothetical protein